MWLCFPRPKIRRPQIRELVSQKVITLAKSFGEAEILGGSTSPHTKGKPSANFSHRILRTFLATLVLSIGLRVHSAMDIVWLIALVPKRLSVLEEGAHNPS